MAGTNVLREFVVRLGFKLDEQQFRNFNEGMLRIAKGSAELTKNFVALGEASALSMTAMGAALTAVAKPLEGLYYAAQRTGASAKELDEFSFAASQIGISADKATASIEAMAAARRTNPGLNGILEGFHIDPKQTDNAAALLQLIDKLRGMDVASGNRTHFMTSQWASMFGLDEQTFKQIEDNYPAFLEMIQARDKIIASDGADPNEFSKRAQVFMRQLGFMNKGLLDLSRTIATSVMPWAEVVMGWVENLSSAFMRLDKATDGWSSKLIALGLGLRAFAVSLSLIGRITGITGIFKGLGKLAGFGRVAGAAAGEAAGGAALAEGEEVAAASGPVGWVVGIGVAVAAGLVWMQTHPEQVRAAVKGAWEWVKQTGSNAAAATKSFVSDIKDSVNKYGIGKTASMFALGTGNYGLANIIDKMTNATAPDSPLMGMLSKMIVAHEGIRKSVYKDVAGLATIGVGHLIMPGEDFSKGLGDQGIAALLIKDIVSAIATVHRLVKAKLNDNQTAALADFVFNVGGGKFANSTLLKKLNSGDFAGAADQFQYWNHALVNGHMATVSHLSEIRAQEASMFRGGTPLTITQKTDIHVDGGEAHSTAREVARQQGRVNGDMVRNFAGAAQ